MNELHFTKTTALSFNALNYVLRGGLSTRAAAFVAQSLLKQHGLSDSRGAGMAREHGAKHGVNGSEEAQKVLAKLSRRDRFQLETWLYLATELRRAQEQLFIAEQNLKGARAALDTWIENPLTREQAEQLEHEEMNAFANAYAEVEAEERNGNTHSIPRGYSLKNGVLHNQFGEEVQ